MPLSAILRKDYHTHAQVLDESIYEELVHIEEYANTKPPKSDTHQRRLATTHKLFTFNKISGITASSNLCI
jgi:hypothetical protein